VALKPEPKGWGIRSSRGGRLRRGIIGGQRKNILMPFGEKSECGFCTLLTKKKIHQTFNRWGIGREQQ